MRTIPQEPGDITSEWLGQVLDVPVRRHRVIDAHAGTTGRAVLELEYAQPTGLPRRLFVKLPPLMESQRAFVCSTGMGRREVLFYQQLSGEVPVRVPRCFHAEADDAGTNYIMLLEHLEDSDCTFHPASQRYSLGYVRAVLAAFARLHARYWQSPRLEADLAWVEAPLQHEITAPLIARALRQYGARMPPVFTELGELYLADSDRIHRLWERGEATLIHGDVHDGNMFLDGETPGFLDWALLARGPGMRDVGYFLAGTLTEQDQPLHARELLAYYARQLSANGAAEPALADLWRQYQWHAAYVWVGATVTLAMGGAWQPVNYIERTLTRLHAALKTLDSVAEIRRAL